MKREKEDKSINNPFLPIGILDSLDNKNITLRNHTDSYICQACLWTTSKIQKLAMNYGWFVMNPVAVILFSVGLQYKVCQGIIGEFGPNVYDSLLDHYFSPEAVCTILWVCPHHFVLLDADDYAYDLLKDKKNQTLPKIDKEAKVWKALHVTDIHTDPYYKQVY